MSQDSHSHSGAHYTTNWPAVIGVALLVPIAVSGPIVSLLFSPTSSESLRPVVRNVAEPVEIAASKRLPFQGPPATAPLPALDSDPMACTDWKIRNRGPTYNGLTTLSARAERRRTKFATEPHVPSRHAKRSRTRIAKLFCSLCESSPGWTSAIGPTPGATISRVEIQGEES